MKRIARLLLVSVLVVFVSQAVFAQGKNTKLMVPLGWLNNDEFVALQVADAQGFYNEQGISVTLVSGGGSTGFDPILAVNGFDPSIRFGVEAALSQVITARSQGIDVVAVAALQQYEPSGFITLITPDRRAQSPCDFKGRVVAMQPDTTWYVDALGAKCPESEGGPLVSGKDFTVIPAGFSPDCLLTGDCDYYCGWKTNQLFEFAQMGKVYGTDYEMFLTSDYLPFYYTDVVITTRAFAEQNPDLVRGFVKATMQGLDFTLNNPNEAVAISSEVPGVAPEHATWRIPIQNELAVSPETDQYGLGYMDLDKVQAMIDTLYELGQIDVQLSASDVIDNSYLPGPING
jgi:NitT/TauT family transport system substrate-binding protein